MDSFSSSHLIKIIRAELPPPPVNPPPPRTVLFPLHGIRAVVFDVYGTLLKQGRQQGRPAEAAADCFRAARDTGLLVTGCPAEPVESLLRTRYREAIAREHQRGRSAGVPYPEVDIEQIWFEALRTEELRGYLAVAPDRDAVRELAVRFECYNNPVWLMPGAADTLRRLQRRRLRLGIVSNAQFYTPLVLEALFGAPPADLGLEESLCIWSYRLGRAKPDPVLFELLCNRLSRLRRQEILYVGNDPEQDVIPAAATGCRTCLLVAGGDPAEHAGEHQGARHASDSGTPVEAAGLPLAGRSGVAPDRVITALPQVAQIAVSRRTLCGNSSLSLSFC